MQAVKYRFGRGPHSLSLSSTSPFGLQSTNGGDGLLRYNSRPTNSISIENIPDHVERRELVSLFGTLIGEIRSFQDIRDGPSPRLEITFNDQDSASKALCMNGYTVAGSPLTVSALTMSSPIPRAVKRSADDRRNLYVLGLPFALTKQVHDNPLQRNPYGTVVHCVILATVDNSSRRRGFVVMSSHEEAKTAMTALTRTQIKGHMLDVSWAVVQRSQGFLDGGDRGILLDSRPQLPCPSPKLHEARSRASSDTSDSSLGSHDADLPSLVPSSSPTASLLVCNLPTLFFSQAQDLHPLFVPFGNVEKLEIIQVSPLGTLSVFVQYSSVSGAQEAKDSLTGQIYGNCQLEARYVKYSNTPAILSPTFSATGISTPDRVPLPPVDYFSHSRGELLNQASSFVHPMKTSLTFNPFGPPLLRHNSFTARQRTQTPLSAIQPAAPHALYDFNDSLPTSTGSRWSTEKPYGTMVNLQRQCAQPKPLQLGNTVYQSSAA
ncbi:hypothetical protein NLJ89_g2907 [Agrocybe chaxingu]|uniref:RRM domain-containing protein n=1 Tax=Agrocybe chaxingu TaxID=84603 RepID=A0A9W8MYJ4_9AGAR|nr:hypothetical protein NLJ89_g2907 [Agrocybe chaxingu]